MTKKETTQTLKAIAEIQSARSEGETVRENARKMCAAVGYDAFREAVAAAVKSMANDGRISRDNKSRAAAVETCNECGEYIPGGDAGTIHPAHLDQLAAIVFTTTRDELEPAPAPDYITRPTYNGPTPPRGAALVWFWRACSAYNLAARITGADKVTQSEYNAARKILDSVQRYALADARQWERANTSERYANSETAREDEKRLTARREKLAAGLARYGVRLVNFGLYPSIIDEDGRDLYALHFFN